MAEPTKLIAGTQGVYGKEKAFELYGDIVPIDAERIIEAGDEDSFSFGGREVRALHTEGHARHHYCLHDPHSRGVFTGDSFGISYRELDTENGEFIFPTSTPPHFEPTEAHKAVDRIMAQDPEKLYLTHYSRVNDVGRLADDMHDCLDGFVAIARRHQDRDDRQEAMEGDMFEFLAERLVAHGYTEGREAMWSLLKHDMRLNSQGLDAWLSWLER